MRSHDTRLKSALQQTAKALGTTPWCLHGSAGLHVRGLLSGFNDIDVQTTRVGVRKLVTHFNTINPGSARMRGPAAFSSAHIETADGQIEAFADNPLGKWILARKETTSWRGMRFPVLPTEDMLCVYALLERHTRVEQIGARLRIKLKLKDLRKAPVIR